jgi:hypothetical protein
MPVPVAEAGERDLVILNPEGADETLQVSATGTVSLSEVKLNQHAVVFQWTADEFFQIVQTAVPVDH